DPNVGVLRDGLELCRSIRAGARRRMCGASAPPVSLDGNLVRLWAAGRRGRFARLLVGSVCPLLPSVLSGLAPLVRRDRFRRPRAHLASPRAGEPGVAVIG